MADQAPTPAPHDEPLPPDVVDQLAAHSITSLGEVELRHELERRISS